MFSGRRQLILIAFAGAVLTVAARGGAQPRGDAPDLAMYARIRDEGTARSQIMDFATELVDGIGPRLTGSPNLGKAVAWAQDRFRRIGLSNVRTESWGEFGMGWEQRHVSLRLTAPDRTTLIACAAPWSPPTKGVVAGDVVAVRGFTSEDDYEKVRGTLGGKIVLYGRAKGLPDVPPIDKPLFQRLDDRQLAELAGNAPESDPLNYEEVFGRAEFDEGSGRFLAKEGVAAVIVPSGNDRHGGISGGTIWADNNLAFGQRTHDKAHAMQVPLVVVTNEHYGRMRRLLERGVPVRVELNVDTVFTGDREEGLNVFGEIRGVERADEFVLTGAHLDSWAAGTGATDNGAGVVIVMEAMRILRALNVQPRRTIRIALWTGEEQGVLGAIAYVKRYLATIPRATTPEQMPVPEHWRRITGPITAKPDHARLSAYFNVDGGSGRIRGVNLSGNVALEALFRSWIAPLADLGVAFVAPRRGCGSDCGAFADAGIPTPSFVHDPLDYDTRTHHTNMDTFEHLVPEDLRQAAVVLATLLYNTAMREELLPRR